jgi:heme-degrading monooxygenase HmoA
MSMIVTLFRSRLTSQAGDDYIAMSAEMLDRAKSYPGFVAMKSFKAEDGERLTVVWWESD